eukprot:COSAG01_NODE_54_length_31327_cov_317.045356_29_plen_40_part_00
MMPSTNQFVMPVTLDRNGGVLTQAYTDKFSQFLGRSTKA